MLLAHRLAEWSIEKGRRVGAVIVGPDNEIRSTGFNGLARERRADASPPIKVISDGTVF